MGSGCGWETTSPVGSKPEGASPYGVLDMAGNYDQFSQFIHGRIGGEFGAYGLELTKLLVENISLPPAVEEALDKRTSMGVIGDLDKYQKFQTAEAIGDMAKNPGGGGAAGAGMGAGMGFAMGNQMAQAMTPQQGGQAPAQGGAAPPPIPQGPKYFAAIGGQQAGLLEELYNNHGGNHDLEKLPGCDSP